MEFRTFSCFDNFVPTVKYGAPAHCPNHHGLKHLELILKTLSGTIERSQEASSQTQPRVGWEPAF